MKTLHLTNAYHATSGGIRTFYLALLRRANERQRLMRLVVPAEEDATEEFGRYGLIYYVRAQAAPAFDRRYRLMLPSTYLPGTRGRVQAILEHEQPDVVEICDKYSLPYLAGLVRRGWFRGLRRPALVGVSCERMDDNILAYLGGAAVGRRFARWYLRHIYGPPFDRHIANSEYTAAELRDALSDRAADFVQVCPMGVHVDRFGPQYRDEALRRTLLERCGGGPASLLLMYVGRLSPEKNVMLLTSVVEHLVRASHSAAARDYRLAIIGDGPLADVLAASSVRDRVLMLGAISDHALLARHYASADVFVHPNPREPFGIAPLEAMASGIPVVVPDRGGVLSYAGSRNAWLAAPEPDVFARAVRSAVEEPDPQRLANARDTANQYDWRAVADAWFAQYDRVARRFATTSNGCVARVT